MRAPGLLPVGVGGDAVVPRAPGGLSSEAATAGAGLGPGLL